MFLCVILVIELWRFLTTEAENDLGLYLLWVFCFVPTLYLASPAYRNGYGFAEHLSAFLLVPPVVILAIRSSRYLLMTKVDVLRQQARRLSLGLTLVSLVLASGYVLIQLDTFADTTVPLSQNRLMQNIGELKNPVLEHWMIRYGSVFILGCLGLAMAVIRFWKRQGLLFVVPLLLFTLTVFYRSRLNGLWGSGTGNLLFGVSLATCALGLFALTLRGKKGDPKNEMIYVVMSAWFLLWVALTRDAKRYDFFIGISLAFFTADLIQYVAIFYSNIVKRRVPRQLVKATITACLLLLILFFSPFGGHATQTLNAAKRMRQAIPGKSSIAQTLKWVKDNLPDSAVVAGSWNYGSLLNVLGGVKTIIDQDHYIQHWIYLYNRHVHCATTVQEALEFLKTHEATHLLLEAQDTFFNADYYSSLGSDENGDIRFTITPLQKHPPKDMKYRVAPGKHANIPLEFIDFDLVRKKGLTVRAKLKTGETVHLPAVALINKGHVTTKNNNQHGGVLIIFNEAQHPEASYYIPPLGWDTLAVRLYFRGDISDDFVPVYPPDRPVAAAVKIWEIRYPPHIKPNPKYLKTGIPEIDAQLHLQ